MNALPLKNSTPSLNSDRSLTFSMPYFSHKEKSEGALDMVYPAYQKAR